MKIDAHQHYWTIGRGDYFWMDDSVAAIRRDIGPADLDALRTDAGIEGTVVVQAAPTVAESDFLLGLADETPSILGVVGWVDLGTDTATADLRRLAAHPRFKGIRPMLQDIDDTRWILRGEVIEALNTTANMGLRLDALITPRHLSVIDELAQRLPNLPIVVDHCAKPEIRDGADAGAAWRAGMQRLAEHPQIMCKLSGLASEHGPGWTVDSLRPVFDHVLACFGADRVMWGSDWPVLELAGDYAAWHRCAQSLAAELSAAERHDLFGQTAQKFYGLSV